MNMFMCSLLLTSKLARQYQQKTCLQRLHIIWAQPSSFSMGTAHMGQHLIRSLSNGIPMSSWPSAAKRRLYSSHVIFGCHLRRWEGKKTYNFDLFTQRYLSITLFYLLSFCMPNKIHPYRMDIVRHTML